MGISLGDTRHMMSSFPRTIPHTMPILGRCKSETTSSSDSAAELGIDNVGGVFVVLGFGCFTALIIGVLEFLWNVRRVAVDERITPWEAFKAELKFALNIWITTKPIRVHGSGGSTGSKGSSSKSRAESESRSTAMANILHATSSTTHLDKIGTSFGHK